MDNESSKGSSGTRQGVFRRLIQGTTTPLASIFGSGFLVVVSLLASTVGPYSLFAIIGICAFAYAVGWVIRHNIRHVEPALAALSPPRTVRLLEQLSDITLIPAYIISVTLYLRIMASYVLGYFEADAEIYEKLLTSGIIIAILLIELTKGLKILEGLERWTLIITLAIIFLMIGSFAFYNAAALTAGTLILPDLPDHSLWQTVTILCGILIVVQGFETTRYLGDELDADTRIRASRNSQLFSAAIYILFILVATPLMHLLSGDATGNGLIMLATEVAAWLVVPLVFAAVFSQFGAAIAEAISASGNIMELTRHRLTTRVTYIIICGLAIALTWTADTFEILALASRAFAFYFFLQCIIACDVAKKKGLKAAFAILAALLLFITIFAVPAG
ncbi:hypothetical protein [uncultured Sneathiella sp.]|jgi:hypothetical protein|uniref:hypothetical protein n=1 Tax=uncultured Sneathiella sp. TaxID=879315 RepID=UPI0030DCC199|tara:strand:- start:498 stop:1670 length:1173 start_codon:yes stop_codon:yes gene_type:complete